MKDADARILEKIVDEIGYLSDLLFCNATV